MGLDQAWDNEARSYKGPVEGNGDGLDYRVSELEMEGCNLQVFPTAKRVVSESAVDLDKPHDGLIVYVPGWGETTAQTEGGFLQSIYQVLADKRVFNPRVVGVNPSGRGTAEYHENRDRISKIGITDELKDTKQIARQLYEQWLSETFVAGEVSDVTLVGHSMGALGTMAFAEGLLEIAKEFDDTRINISRIVHLMPAISNFASLKFFKAVFPHVAESLKQRVQNSGYLEIPRQDHYRMMFENEDIDPAHYDRGVPDSAKRFLDLLTNRRSRFEGVLANLKDTEFFVLEGAKDRLLPVNMGIRWHNYLLDTGHASHHVVGKTFPHSFPYKNFREDQSGELRSFWNRVF